MSTTEARSSISQPYQNQQPRRSLPAWAGRVLMGLLITLVVLAMSGAGYQALATARDARAFPLPGKLVDVGGYKLHLYCLGTGAPTIVTENGLGGSSPDWSLVQPAVSQTTRVCSYDRAGSGWSEVGPAPRSSQQIAKELHTLLINAGLPGPYILVGHSAGGMHAQVYASQYPTDVAGLVLVDPTPAQLIMGFSPQQRGMVLPDPGQFQQLKILQFFGLLRFIRLPGDEALASLPPALQAQIRAQRLQSGAVAAMSAEIESFETSFRQTAEATPLPSDRPLIIVWHGIPAEPVELEPQAKAAMEELVHQSNNSKLIVAENSGHYITFDRPDLVIDAINQVVAAVRTGALLQP